ncbi:MAG TPA: tetratricopeptide repeat protein [Chroococcales cyanobacterium]
MKSEIACLAVVLTLVASTPVLASEAEDKLTLGDSLMAQGNASAALHFYDQAQALNDSNWKIYVHRGDALMRLGQRQYAIDDYNKALKLYPGCPAALARLHGGGRRHTHKKKPAHTK